MIDTLFTYLRLAPKDVKIYAETEYMPMGSSAAFPVGIAVTFLIFVYIIGPWLEHKIFEPTDEPSEEMRYFLGFVYEILACSNAVLALSMSWLMYSWKYSVWCQPISPSTEHGIAELMWFFLVTKIAESLETILWLCANEFNYRATHFMAYHHVTSILLAWLAIKIAPGGTACVLATMNSWAHVLMYGFLIFKWKGFQPSWAFKLSVLLSLALHFFISALICLIAEQKRCGFPTSVATGLIFYMMTLFISFLLSNTSYIKKHIFPNWPWT